MEAPRKATRSDLYAPGSLRQVAKWFYQDGHSKTTILKWLREKRSEKLGVRVVPKMLKEAREQGIVTIGFPEELSQERRLELDLENKFDLDKVFVVPLRENEEYTDLLTRWGAIAAEYLDELFSEYSSEGRDLHVGISGGETLLYFVNAIKEKPRKRVHVHTIALIGRGKLPPTSSHVDPIVNATILWAKCGRLPGHCHYATVSPYDCLTQEQIAVELRRLSQSRPIRDTLDDMKKVDVVFAGLGLVQPDDCNPQSLNQVTMTGLLSDVTSPSALAADGAIGDLSYCLFDRECKSQKKWEFFLTAGYGEPKLAGLSFYRSMIAEKGTKKRVVVIAGQKKRSVLGPALQKGLFNVWITDDSTARWAMRELSL